LTPVLSYATFVQKGTMNVNERFQPLRNGLLEFVVLKIIAAHKVYVADILATLKDTEFKTQEGTLYPLLSRLRRDGVLEYEWRESETGPPRKYYALTAKGETQLAELKDYWKRINTTLDELGN
jgi:PadR family transcriptional regulator PadR